MDKQKIWGFSNRFCKSNQRQHLIREFFDLRFESLREKMNRNAIEQTGLRNSCQMILHKLKSLEVSCQSKETHAAMILLLIWESFKGRSEQLERNVVQMRDIERKEKTLQLECVVHCSCKATTSWESTQRKKEKILLIWNKEMQSRANWFKCEDKCLRMCRALLLQLKDDCWVCNKGK